MNAINFADSSLHIGNLTITGTQPGDQPSVVAGAGLGNAKIYPASSIDRFLYFPAGATDPSVDEKESIYITCTTKISAIAITPSFAILGLNNPTKFPFPIRYRLFNTGQGESDRWLTLDPNNTGQVSIPLQPHAMPSGIQMDVSGDTTFATYFQPFRQSLNLPAVGFLVGFSIKLIVTT